MEDRAIVFHKFSVKYKVFRHIKATSENEHEKNKERLEIIERALHQKKIKLKKSIIKSLREYAEKKTRQRRAEDERVKVMKRKLLRMKGVRILQSWRHCHREKVLKCINMERAVMHHQRIEKERAMKQLYAYVMYRRKRAELNMLSYSFALEHQVSRCFHKWHGMKEDVLTVKSKNRKASFLHSKHLVRKTFCAFKSYISYSRKKSKLEMEALERRRVMLLRRGLMQIMESAYEHNTENMKRIERDCTKSTYESLKRVEKFARHWLYVTIRNSHRRGSGLFSGLRDEKTILPQTFAPVPSVRLPPRRPMEFILREDAIREQQLKEAKQVFTPQLMITQQEEPRNIKPAAVEPVVPSNKFEEPILQAEEYDEEDPQDILGQKIDHIKTVLEEYEHKWTPVYEFEKEKRKKIRDILESCDEELDEETREGLVEELVLLEKRAKSYLNFKREELPKLIGQLHDLVQHIQP